ncbi:ABC-type antimicrobial peptide transport system, ATPase component [Candidatus Methanoperedens nitroreducens]|uniref:ABC-type antimicrobial peptide transport system, ATPase component n=1 Tax=Candidatus Methanoperedens nitratireducens TaxID=1392998 RepID=A0A062V7N0_9EURY|nr:ABC transporter ATP-binding protein [Candidatus Methanoperedens nitroreducens]KCZ71779.1 ABC-type antimicrobial peptide transport system, ATPase component [Candidatus Methanoperedens nitroreducens]MDJ1422247.1 ABC transporter ATP-binding protein [Candidatus Methanoperedens sp.]
MRTVLSIEDVSKSYTLGKLEVPVLHDINLAVSEGEFAAIMGPSGSGKSTLMNLIGCLDRPTTGKIIIGDRDTSILSDMELALIRGKKIGFIFQTFNLVSRLSALKNVELPMVYQDIPKGQRIRRAKILLEMLGLGDRTDHKPAELSGGQRQRVAIARALANEPEILLADEPTGNLDSKTGKEIMQIFSKLHNDGRTILMVTHDNGLAQNCDRIIRLKDGRIEDD